MWRKCGKINEGHAQTPVVQRFADGYRIFVTARTEANHSYIRRFDFDMMRVSDDCTFACGVNGGFDENGVMTSCIVGDNLYYTAWKKLGDRYKQSIAVLNTDLTSVFDRRLVIDSTKEDEHLCSSPFVVRDGTWKMWFISGRHCGGWTPYGPKYTIRYAESVDGIKWDQRDIVFSRKDNEVFARPFVRFHGGVWQMWYSYLHLSENKAYRIGYAESEDGILWRRLDELAGIDVSSDGWDSETVAFPFIVETPGQEIMFYSGNHFGRGGIGYAVRNV